MRDYKHRTIAEYSWKDDAFKDAVAHYLKERGTFRTVVDGPADVVLYLEAKYNFYLFLLLHSCSLEVTLTRGETAGSNDGEPLGSYSGHGTHLDTIIGNPTLIRQNTIAEALDDLFVKIDRDRKVILAKTAQKPLVITASNSPTPDAVSQNPLVTDAALDDVDRLPDVTSKKVNGYAVVIGIEQYREKLPKADFADRDAKLVGEYLTKMMGYPEENVVVRTNDKASMNDFVKYLESWLPSNVEKNSSVFIYYSGHGAPNPRTGDAYLVPYDGDPSFIDSTGYPVKRLYAALDKLPVNDVTVVLDSCFSGAGGRSVLAEGARPMVLSVK
ncbi:MAG: caspase family protein, partial [Nitrospira sp.]|nr:caspase family protein [Nitrospira sp.]